MKRHRFTVVYVLHKQYWVHHFGFERTERKRDLALFLFPFHRLHCRIPVELETVRSISPQIKAHMMG